MVDDSPALADQLQRFVQRLGPPPCRTLEGKFLAGAEEIEMTATDGRSGPVLDRTATTSIPNLKQFVRKNPAKAFILRVRAGATVAQRVRAALGPGDKHVSASPGQKISLQELDLNLVSRDLTFVALGEIYAWNGITILWPRDAVGRSTVRGGLLVLDSTA